MDFRSDVDKMKRKVLDDPMYKEPYNRLLERVSEYKIDEVEHNIEQTQER